MSNFTLRRDRVGPSRDERATYFEPGDPDTLFTDLQERTVKFDFYSIYRHNSNGTYRLDL